MLPRAGHQLGDHAPPVGYQMGASCLGLGKELDFVRPWACFPGFPNETISVGIQKSNVPHVGLKRKVYSFCRT
jgi:hypothetical protein